MWIMFFTFPVLIFFMLFAKFIINEKLFWKLRIDNKWSHDKAEKWVKYLLFVVWFIMILSWTTLRHL